MLDLCFFHEILVFNNIRLCIIKHIFDYKDQEKPVNQGSYRKKYVFFINFYHRIFRQWMLEYL